jgi:hypothetical protein
VGTFVFRFERDGDPEGRWIPMAVRMKLDLASLKIGLEDWTALDARARQALCDAVAESDDDVARFRTDVVRMLADCGRDAPVRLDSAKVARVAIWRDAGPPPDDVARMLARLGHENAWSRLDRFGRYVAVALAAKKDADKLSAALAELEAAARTSGAATTRGSHA